VIKSYELGFRMQDTVPATARYLRKSRSMYWMPTASSQGWRVPLPPVPDGAQAQRSGRTVCRNSPARMGSSHQPAQGLIDQSRMIDQPTSALLTDLKQRGLLEDTLVLFGSEFGRLPTSQGADGRDHNITGYAMFL
jgi:hypothetical protein